MSVPRYSGLKAEWARSRARQTHWSEERDLVQEEMRRVLMYLEARAVWWENQGDRRSELCSADLAEGLRAYAVKQASILRSLRQCFAKMWYPRLQAFQLTADWFNDTTLGLSALSQNVRSGALDTVD